MTRNDVASISMATGEWNKTRAFVTVNFTNGLVVNGVKVIQGAKGLFVGQPSIQRKNKETQAMEWKDCCFFPDKEDNQAFQTVILDEYNKKVGGGSTANTGDNTSEEEYF